MMVAPSESCEQPEKEASFPHKQFITASELEDINNDIESLKEAISVTAAGDLVIPKYLDMLGQSLHRRFEGTDNLEDLDEAIGHRQAALSLTPDEHPYMPTRLDNLGTSLQSRFRRLGTIADLNKAIDHKQHALSLMPDEDPDMPIQLDNLAYALLRRFERFDSVPDLDKAIEHRLRALSLIPEEDGSIYILLDNLGHSLQTRFERVDNLEDLDKAIEYQQRGLSLRSDEDPDKHIGLNNLAWSLCNRFKRLGGVADLNKAIKYQQRALSLTPDGHPHMPFRPGNLGSFLQSRFEHQGNLEDLNAAIRHHEHALSLVPERHPDMALRLNNVGHPLHQRFELQGNLEDVDKAIEHQRRALLLIPEKHPSMPMQMDNLGCWLQSRFGRLGNLGDLDEAIEYHQQALSLTPDGHPDRLVQLNNLGGSLLNRFERQGNKDDLAQSIHSCQMASLSFAGSLKLKFQATLNWAEACDRHRTGESLDAYKQAMALLPQLVWLGGSVVDRYNNIIGVGDICSKAVAAAIAMNNYELGLEWIEQGRSIVWKQILQLRTPVDDLCAVDPDLAAELKQVAHDLEQVNSSGHPATTSNSSHEHSLEDTARRHRRLAEKWEKLVEMVRQLPGFGSFLRPKSASDLMLSAQSGPVVIVNVHESRCDALIVRPGCKELSHVPLKRFTNKKATQIGVRWEQLVRSEGSIDRAYIPPPKSDLLLESTLAVLWEEVASPVLTHLGYTNCLRTDNLPRVTWCTTGSLSFLPLHAAGNYGAQVMIYNYVVSSYTPMLSVLLQPTNPVNSFSGLLAVGQKSTPGQKPLPFTEVELACIQDLFKEHVVTQLDGDKATPSAVLAEMEKHSWVHLACHAIQNTLKPTESAFHLHGGTLDLATITQKQLKQAELAFLSACETATGDERLPDEAVHLAAGILISGYRTVIATMWSIEDNDAPLIAEKVYEHLLEGGTPCAQNAAVAVHKATECLRAKVGVKEFAKWAPYIHIGL
ncbi:TPR-like protein [Ceratobasidium sp. AG-I]|nr:TPR-like protein [Ceratobasidium sp. AG-I]